MGVTIFRPGQRLVIPGVQVMQTKAAASSWWLSGGIGAANCIAAYAPKGAADLASSYINLANPGTYNAAPGVAPTFNTADGWTFNGTTQYLTCGIVPALTWSMIIRLSAGQGTATGKTTAGVYHSTTQSFLIQPHGDFAGEYEFWNGNTLRLTGGQKNSGVFCVAGKGAYYDGANVGTITAGGTNPTNAIYIGALNFGGTAINLFGHKIQAFAIYNTTLTAGQVSDLTTAINLI